jgi:hypothetical protein
MSDKRTLKEIAERLNLNPVSVGRLINQKMKELNLTKIIGRRNEVSLSREDADKLIASYEGRRGPIYRTTEDATKFEGKGWFYIVQLVPELSPVRVKVGYADDFSERLKQHRTAAPTARLLKKWRCKRSWESAARDSITREGCKSLSDEVYEGDIKGFLERAESFFGLMPKPDAKREQSEHLQD